MKVTPVHNRQFSPFGRIIEMQKNVGSLDRVIRILFAVVVALLYFTNQISGTLALILGILGIVLLATAVVGFCPIYWPLKLSTTKKQ
jgi:uncharacterized integral membrane protein